MYPVLFSIGNLSVSSFGVFLALGFLLGIFLIWRLARAWDLPEEKVLDLIFLTIIGGFIGARAYFVVEHLQIFITTPLSVFLINKVPGLNFWGGFLGGWLILYVFAKRLRFDFWQIADIASVGLLGGLIFSSAGCLLGGCSAGIPSKAFFAVVQQGLMGRRWPVQLLEALLLAVALIRIWGKATHFHQRGKIASTGFIYIGIIGFLLEPLKKDHTGGIFSIVLTVLGLTIFYRVTKQNPLAQIKELKNFMVQFIAQREFRKKVMQNLGRYWYNQKAMFIWKLKDLKKSLRRV